MKRFAIDSNSGGTTSWSFDNAGGETIMSASERSEMMKRPRLFTAVILAAISFIALAVVVPAWSAFRIDSGADIHASPETVEAIENTFVLADSAIKDEDLDALMQVYSENYRYQDLTKADMRKIWQDFFEQYDRVDTLYAFSRIMVTSGTPSTAEITSTGAIWATSVQTNQRVDLASWVGDIHHLILEDGMWKILGPGKNAPNRSEFGQAPPPLF